MTKAEKERAKKAQAKLESLKAAGLITTDIDAVISTTENKDVKPSALFQYSKKKKNNAKQSEEVKPAVEEVKPVVEKAPEPEAEEKPVFQEAEWDEDDDWESASAAPSNFASKISTGVEDLSILEQQKEQEKIKQAGLERAKREEEQRKKREQEEAERRELERKELEAQLKKEQAILAREKREILAASKSGPHKLRSPISVIMGHVDTGKTSLLDKIRQTNVQEGEAGGITQQIGATQFPKETLAYHTRTLQKKYQKEHYSNIHIPRSATDIHYIHCPKEKDSEETVNIDEDFEFPIPGLLMIDTPGHESFTNLRSRGSSLCDVAILVVDLMHGLEPQTIESLNLLVKKKTPFIIALNKVDRCYGWKKMPDAPIRIALAAQDENTRFEFEDRLSQITLQLNELGHNVSLYWKNSSPSDTISMIPTSAHSGEGVADLIYMLMKNLTVQEDSKKLQDYRLQNYPVLKKLHYVDFPQATVLEVKVIEGFGHTMDIVLVNGTLKEGDTIILSTLDGPITTTVRSLLTPPPNREMRIAKNDFVHHPSISGAVGVKIVAHDLVKVLAGTSVLVAYKKGDQKFDEPNAQELDIDDDLDFLREESEKELKSILKLNSGMQTDMKGVTVHASTLGALEALLQFLREECKPPIPVSHAQIGPIHKKDIMKTSIMNDKKLPEFATILAFDVPIDQEVEDFAQESGVKIFKADIIYHLFDQFTAYMKNIRETKKNELKSVVVFPCVLKILPNYIFNKKDPIVIGVEVLEGTLKLDTPICIHSLSEGTVDIGRVVSMEMNHKETTSAKKSMQVSIRIVNESNPNITYGRHFDHNNSLYSKISRASIDACKEFFADEMTKEDWALTIKLKKVFNIP